MSYRSLRAAIVAVAAALGAACGPVHHRGTANDATIVFENQSLNQADVFAVGTAGDPVRIGTVFPGRTERLTLDLGMVSGAGSINIVARMLATGRAPRTGLVTLRPGDVLRVTLPQTENQLTALPGS